MASLFPCRWLHYTFFKTIIRRRFPSQNSSSSFPKCPRIFPNMPLILPGMFPECSGTSPLCPVMFQISSQNEFKREEMLPQNGFKPPKSNQNRVKLSIFCPLHSGKKTFPKSTKIFLFFSRYHYRLPLLPLHQLPHSVIPGFRA